MIELEKGNDMNVDFGKANAMLKHQQNMFKHLQTSKQIITIIFIITYVYIHIDVHAHG